MEITCARARLRKGKDNDLINAFRKVPSHYDQSYIVREALRQFFFAAEGRVHLFTPQQLFNEESIVQPQHRSYVKDVELDFDNTELKLEKIEEDDINLDKAIDSLLD